VALVGSRDDPGLLLVAKPSAALSEVVVMGDAAGIDSAAYAAAHEADQLLAFWHGQFKGTDNSIDLAPMKGIPLPIIPRPEIKENAVPPRRGACPHVHPRHDRQHPHNRSAHSCEASLLRD
jgi:hypothetical protein